MEVTYILGKEVNSDLGVVNAARVSLGKRSELEKGKLSERDSKLIHFLAQHNHWTPFGHPRMYFSIEWETEREALYFYKNINSGGMAWVEHIGGRKFDLVKGSLYSWVRNIQFLPLRTREYIERCIYEAFPISAEALGLDHEPFTYNTRSLVWSEEFVASNTPYEWKVLSATLLLKVPIFIARQIRTSQVGLAYSDLYVEGESFVYNEVSRRYVSDNPEFYEIKEWRVREGSRVKQGSTGVGDSELQQSLNQWQRNTLANVGNKDSLYSYWAEKKVAPEQLRALLPQSMYTEFYMTGTLHRWAQFLALRLKEDVQQETREVAGLILEELGKEFPLWKEDYNL